MSEESSVVSSTAGRLSKYPFAVVSSTLIIAAVLTAVCFAIDMNSLSVISVVGVLATVWALILAIVIYVLTAKDTDNIVREIQDLTEQIAELAPDPAPQSSGELMAAVDEYRDYIDALRGELNIPIHDLTSVTKPGEGKGNRPVIVETRLKKRYSVFKGGRAKSGFTVTKLDRPEVETVR